MGALESSERSVSPRSRILQRRRVPRCLVTDLNGKQGCAIALVRDREVLKPLLPEGIQVSLHPNDVSHTLVLRSDDVFSSEKKDTLWAGETQSPNGYQKATFERREEQPEEEQMVAKRLPCITACIGAVPAMPCLWVTREERAQSNESARARAMACVRFSAPSLLKILATCFLAVANETTSCLAIS